jgi:hypothetical protein
MKKAERKDNDTMLDHRKQFEEFHNQNGVRTIMGSIGPVQNGAHDLAQLYRPFPSLTTV